MPNLAACLCQTLGNYYAWKSGFSSVHRLVTARTIHLLSINGCMEALAKLIRQAKRSDYITEVKDRRWASNRITLGSAWTELC